LTVRCCPCEGPRSWGPELETWVQRTFQVGGGEESSPWPVKE
jgi:hypothetical protein